MTHFSKTLNQTAIDAAQENETREFFNAYTYAGIIIFCACISIIITHPFTLYATQMGIRIRLTCCALIYRKTLKITKSMTPDGLNGKIINLMSTDVQPFDQSMFYIHLLWKGPVELLLFGYLIYREIGFYGWIGCGFILCFVPIQCKFICLQIQICMH